MSRQTRVNVAGISAVWQRLYPSLYGLGIGPLCEGQALGLAQSGIVTVRAERLTAGYAINRDSAQDRCEFEGECLEGPRKSRERLGLETFDIDFGKNRLAMTFDQLVQGDCRSDKAPGPTLTPPARRRRRRGDKARRCGGQARIVEVDEELDISGSRGNRHGFDYDLRITPVKAPQYSDEPWLRLDRNDPAAEAAK